ncbi:sensor histidine kinase [bacterium]|nr:sensor histidine kinase [bacterium]
MIDIAKIRYQRILSHVLFWIFYLAFNTFMHGFGGRNYSQQFTLFLAYLPVIMLATYTTLYVLIPTFLLRKRFVLFSLLLAVSALLFAALQWLHILYVVTPLLIPQEAGQYSFFSIGLLYRIFSIYEVVAVAAAIKLAKHWYASEYLKQEAEKEKLHAELAYLKAQIHPHFLFNTLNNLYALSLKKDPRTSEVILKLSDLLDYMLYRCNTPFIALDREIELIETYCALERLRYGDNLRLTFERRGTTAGVRIAPLLLLPLVENAFKHGTSRNPADPWVELTVQADESVLEFRVRNVKSPGDNAGLGGAGIGLLNIRRRLDLLYPCRHTLSISETGRDYEVHLTITHNSDGVRS